MVLVVPDVVPDVVVPAPARRRWAPWLAAAALAVAAALGFQAFTLRTELASVRGTLSESALRAESLRAELAEARATQLQRAFNAEAVDSLCLETDKPYVAALMAFFKNRVRKRS